jgi:hypothetical protein
MFSHYEKDLLNGMVGLSFDEREEGITKNSKPR